MDAHDYRKAAQEVANSNWCRQVNNKVWCKANWDIKKQFMYS